MHGCIHTCQHAYKPGHDGQLLQPLYFTAAVTFVDVCRVLSVDNECVQPKDKIALKLRPVLAQQRRQGNTSLSDQSTTSEMQARSSTPSYFTCDVYVRFFIMIGSCVDHFNTTGVQIVTGGW